MKENFRLQADIARLLKLIQDTNQLLDSLYQSGKEENSLAIRQEKHVRQRYTTEPDKIMKNYRLTVSEVEI